jgi:succinoglycan biosynthesis protein ExoM
MQASIIITTFRRAQMLDALLTALVPQLSGRNAEILVIDNCPDASARDVAAGHGTALRYIHEPRSGVVHARNRGVAEAQGDYVIFLDDDEMPVAGWLAAFLTQADGETDIAFGRIAPRCLGPCPLMLQGQIDRLFSRTMADQTGTDITPFWAYLGTGNALFRKASCFAGDTPFDLRFNARGGEDIWLIRGLIRQGKRLLWNNEALVDELVPADRMTLNYLKSRKFNQGQLRCIFVRGDGGAKGLAQLAIWMGAGAVQYVVFGIAAFVTRAIGHHSQADHACRAAGGLGKLLWWQDENVQHYQGE